MEVDIVSNGRVRVFEGTDENVQMLREACSEEDVDVIDMRTPWRRAWHWTKGAALWFFIIYFFVSHYCAFKLAVGLPATTCGCS